jgi:protein-L-isoaspartate O-methyltransferase
MEPEDYRRTSYDAWEAMAPGWERWRAQLEEALAPVRKWLITELAPRPGETVLELSAGPGDTGFAAAAIVGEQGRLISTDFSPDMVEVARRRGAELGLENVDYRVVDAERIELDADSVVRNGRGHCSRARASPPSACRRSRCVGPSATSTSTRVG